MGNKRNRRSSRGQSPSLERELSTSKMETSQSNETVVEILSNFENVSSVRDNEAVLDSRTQNENEMQIWTQRISDKTNKEVANLRKEMDEKLERVLKVMKNSRRTQSVPSRRYQEQNASEAETSKYIDNEDDEENASDPENQESGIQDNPFRPSKKNELRKPMQPLNIQNIDLNEFVIINEDRTGEDYHMVTENETTELQNFHKPTAGTIDYREGHFRDNAKIRLEHNNDPVLRTLRGKIEGELFDESAFTQDNCYQHYLQKILHKTLRIEIRQDSLARKYYNDNGQISHYQILLPKQLLEEFLQALHGHNANHPGKTEMIQEARQKYYYTCLAKYIKNWVQKCQMCIQNKRIKKHLLKTENLNCPEWDLGRSRRYTSDGHLSQSPT